jgi:hypothetical protein
MMKKLIFYFTLLTIYGCDALPGSSSFVSQSNPTSTASSASGCPDEPTVELREKDVEEISLNEQTLTKSGQASATKAIAYKFAGESGEKFNYQTNQNLCVWIYSPDNQIISGGTLPKSGNYIIQVSAPKGQRKFDLQMRLLDIVLTKDIATQIVTRWYKAKPLIFAPPFDTGLVDKLTTGRLNSRVLGSVDWLRKYDSYYRYNKSEIVNATNFSKSAQQASITINVVEELYLHSPKGIDKENSGTFRNKFKYYFQNDNGVWKISFYEKVR